MPKTQLLSALDFLLTSQFQPGKDVEEAHRICQQHEGHPHFDWLHALVHRIEGDDANADYWYRKAGKTRHEGSVEDEWQLIRSAAQEI